MNLPTADDTRILLLTGGRQVGKSTALRTTIDIVRREGVQVSGLLTQRTGPHSLVVTELGTGATYPLTDPFVPDPQSATPRFRMNADALARSARALAASFPTQVFVLDELGPLEFRQRKGWVTALDLLARESYTVAIVVVRPELLGDAVSELPGRRFTLVRVTAENRETLPALLVHEVDMRVPRPCRTGVGRSS